MPRFVKAYVLCRILRLMLTLQITGSVCSIESYLPSAHHSSDNLLPTEFWIILGVEKLFQSNRVKSWISQSNPKKGRDLRRHWQIRFVQLNHLFLSYILHPDVLYPELYQDCWKIKEPFICHVILFQLCLLLDESLEDYKKVIELDPRHPEANHAIRRLPGKVMPLTCTSVSFTDYFGNKSWLSDYRSLKHLLLIHVLNWCISHQIYLHVINGWYVVYLILSYW